MILELYLASFVMATIILTIILNGSLSPYHLISPYKSAAALYKFIVLVPCKVDRISLICLNAVTATAGHMGHIYEKTSVISEKLLTHPSFHLHHRRINADRPV